ncbi:filamentous hemagglutinin N-terminal domain-containing protein [Acinetobacter gyllenbergii]|nr:filamentous hemagglutinin N-terminal domain-containing protein [Acinetobacter gyllenbergii]
MNKIYQVVWNATHLCWQAVSEKAKGGVVATQSTTKIKSKSSVAHTVKLTALFAVNVLSASIVFAGPTGGVVSSGTASISTAGTTTTINQSTAKAAIDWSSFSTNSNEIVNFVQPNSSSITLNRVTGTSASNLNGQLNANGQVFIINPNGVLFGSTSQVNTAGLVASTLNLSNADFNNNLFNFNNPTNNKTVENRGKITVPTGGTVALIAPTVKQTGTIKAPQGNVLLAAGGDITLNLNNGSLLGYTINQGKAQALINSGGMIQADGGKVILTAKGIDELSNAVVNSVGVIQAQTVNNVRGVIELGSDLSSGTVNVSGTLDASAPNGGNGGQIKTSAAEVHVSSGTNITTQRNSTGSLPPTTSGWELKAKNIDVDFFGGSVSSTTLGDALNKGNVTLNAMGTAEGEGNININDASSWNANTALTLTASKDINFNSDLDLSGDKAKLAMNYGVGSDYNLNNGAKINISGSSPTLLINGSSYIVINDLGEEGDANINTLQGMNNNLTGNYALGSNIDASDTVNWNNGKGFDPIGKFGLSAIVVSDSSSPDGFNATITHTDKPFSGEFHGLGHIVNNLYINQLETLYFPQPPLEVLPVTINYYAVGLFASTTNTIRDIGVTDGVVQGMSRVGGLIGYQKYGLVKNSYSTNSVAGYSGLGGLIGQSGSIDEEKNQLISGEIVKSYAKANISVLPMDRSEDSNINIGGLIGQSFSTIKNSYATGNINIDTNGLFIGGLVGELNNADIINSYATGNVSGDMMYAGGLVGLFNFGRRDSQIANSYATGNVNGLNDIGGLVGRVGTGAMIDLILNKEATATVKNSYATGRVNGSSNIGGLIGTTVGGRIFGDPILNINALKHVYVTDSYASGDVSGQNYIGGLIGRSHENTIKNSYAVGNVLGQNYIGGLIGASSESIAQNSYWNIETSGQSTSAGGTGKTTAELQKILTFSGWDIADASDPNSSSTWVIDEDNATPWLRYNH